MQWDAHQAKLYFLKAVVLVAALMLVGLAAPCLPAFLIPIVLVAFSLLSTCGALYYTVVRRLHRQYKLAAGGQLSHINRRWTWQLVGFMVLFLVSGFFFLLEAPKWDALEWALTWLAIPVYYLVYVFAQQYLRREFAPKFYKANAMKWSFWIVGVLLCLVYALLSLLLPSTDYGTLAEALQQTPRPYASSPSALMGEVDKLTSFADGITAFGISQIADMSAPLAFACRFAIYASVFFGLVNQFGFCLLDADEVRSEFRILPADEEDGSQDRDGSSEPERQPIRRPYVIAVACVLVATMAVCMVLEAKAAEAQASPEATAIESFVDEQTEALVFLVDGAYGQAKEWAQARDDYAQQIADLRKERNEALEPMIDEYYDRCEQNVDSYLEWFYGIGGGWAKLLKPLGNLGADDALKTFRERITQGADGDGIQREYLGYQERIDQLAREASLLDLNDSLTQQLQPGSADGEGDGTTVRLTPTLDLWEPLSGWGRNAIVRDTLLNTDEDVSREEMGDKLRELIEEARADTLAKLQGDTPNLIVTG